MEDKAKEDGFHICPECGNKMNAYKIMKLEKDEILVLSIPEPEIDEHTHQWIQQIMEEKTLSKTNSIFFSDGVVKSTIVKKENLKLKE